MSSAHGARIPLSGPIEWDYPKLTNKKDLNLRILAGALFEPDGEVLNKTALIFRVSSAEMNLVWFLASARVGHAPGIKNAAVCYFEKRVVTGHEEARALKWYLAYQRADLNEDDRRWNSELAEERIRSLAGVIPSTDGDEWESKHPLVTLLQQAVWHADSVALNAIGVGCLQQEAEFRLEDVSFADQAALWFKAAERAGYPARVRTQFFEAGMAIPETTERLIQDLDARYPTPVQKGDAKPDTALAADAPVPRNFTQAEAEAQPKVENPTQACSICLERESVAAFVPCGHLATCLLCSIDRRDCCFCRAPLSMIMYTRHQ